MKKLLFDISNSEKYRILEMHRYATKKQYLTEQSTILNIPSAQLFMQSAPNNPQQIWLSGRDPQTKKLSILKYNIEAEYGPLSFDVNLRKVKRGTDGSLTAEALPDNQIARAAMQKLIPKEHQTKDGWLMVKVPKDKIDLAITQLKQNKGSEAEIDAGQGVSIILTLSK